MIGSHPTRHVLRPWQVVLLVPVTACLAAAFLVLAVTSYAAETVRDIRGR